LCPIAKSFLPGVASAASRRGNRRSNFCLSLAALGPLCGCVTIICLLRALMRTIGNGRLSACRCLRPLPKGAIQAGVASAVRDDSGVRSQRAASCRARHYRSGRQRGQMKVRAASTYSGALRVAARIRLALNAEPPPQGHRSPHAPPGLRTRRPLSAQERSFPFTTLSSA